MLVSVVQCNDSAFVYLLETIIYMHQVVKQKKGRKEGGRKGKARWQLVEQTSVGSQAQIGFQTKVN